MTKRKKPNLQKKRDTQSDNIIKKVMIAPLIFLITILPLVMRIKTYNPDLSQFSWYPDIDLTTDVFLYYRQWILVSIAAIVLLVLFSQFYIVGGKLKKPIALWPLLGYGFFVLLSAIFSKYKAHSFLGTTEQFEGALAILSYLILTFYVIQNVEETKDIKVLIKALGVGALIMSTLGLFQYFSKDFFAMDLGKKLISPSFYWSQLDEIKMTMEANRVYMTLYNPNYVGVYVSLVLPIFIVLFFFAKKLSMKIVYAILSIGLLVSLFGSKSLSGYIGILVSFILILILLRKEFIKNFVISIPILALMICSFLYINKKTDYYLLNKFKTFTEIEKVESNLTDIKTLDDKVVFLYRGNEFNIEISTEEGTFNVYDQDYNEIAGFYDEELGEFTVSDERYPGFAFNYIILGDALGFYVKVDGHQWRFTNAIDDTYYYINDAGKIDKIITAPSALFTGYESLASTRGYIWSRTIPMLKDKIILGSGPDTYTMTFPQQDYVNLQRYFPNSILTKPHSLYLQIAVETGVLSLICFLLIYLIYGYKSLSLYINSKFESFNEQVGVAIFIGITAYMIAGLTNDSSITTAPMFWVLLGVGIVANKLVSENIIEVRDKQGVIDG